MNLYDRLINKNVSEKDLPSRIDFGRYCFGKSGQDITYSNLVTNKAISQELLLEKNKSLQDILIDIGIDVKKSENDNFKVFPLIRRIRNKEELNEFEKLLFEKLFHLEEIFRVPQYLLEREIEKVNVSRAKRIPSKSYQYLASHTEDWIHKSIVNFKPSRILNEELDLNFDIYENQLAVAFVDRCLVYLNARSKELQDIKAFLADYEKLLQIRDDQKGWYKKIIRNLSLIGNAYEDDNFKSENKNSSTLTKTEKDLHQISKRLLKLRQSSLFELVNKRILHSLSLRNTNVLVNHKHYRYLKSLWIELDKIKPEQSATQKVKFEQDVIIGLRDYAKSLITYTLTENLEYELTGNYEKYLGEHLFLDDIAFTETDKGVLELEVGSHNIKIIVIGNVPEYDEELYSSLKKSKTFIFYYNEEQIVQNSQFLHINLLDADSVERVGAFIRKFLLIDYFNNITQEFTFEQSLRDYIRYIPTQFLDFNISNYSYNFNSYPKTKLSFEEVKNRIENDQIFKTKSRPARELILSSITNLFDDIESNADKLKSEYLNCFLCGENMNSYNLDRFNYIKCTSCSCLIDSSNEGQVILKIDDDRNLGIMPAEFGMDTIVVSRMEV